MSFVLFGGKRHAVMCVTHHARDGSIVFPETRGAKDRARPALVVCARYRRSLTVSTLKHVEPQ